MSTATTGMPDSKVDRRVVLSGLWVSTLFVFAYVDIFAFWRVDTIKGRARREGPRRRLRNRPDVPGPDHPLHPDPEPHGRGIASSPRHREPVRQHHRQPALRRLNRGHSHRRDLGVLHRRQRRGTGASAHRRAHRPHLASTNPTHGSARCLSAQVTDTATRSNRPAVSPDGVPHTGRLHAGTSTLTPLQSSAVSDQRAIGSHLTRGWGSWGDWSCDDEGAGGLSVDEELVEDLLEVFEGW